jgi:predicted Zn-dependent protease
LSATEAQMNRKNSDARGIGSAGAFGHTLRQSVALVALFALVLAPASRAADGRTVLKPGWNMFSPQQDIEVGREVSVDAERELPMLKNSRVDNYVNNLGLRLSAQAPGEKYPYAFKVVNDREINAFALPGGPVYINRGVIEAADNEAQLAGVIAHETAHVALRHGTNQASKASAAQVPLAILGGLLGSESTKAALVQLGSNFAVNSILLKYSRTAESQADVMGTQILYDSGYDPRAMAEFFEKIEAGQKGSGPAEFFSNHPSPGNRIESVNREVDALGGLRRDSRTNSREFDDIKRYVQSLPAPKGQQLQSGGQSGTPDLLIVSASYGANSRFIDVRQRMQSRVQNDRLNLQVNTSSMGGNPVNQAKTLQLRYQWNNRAYDITVRDNQQLSIPTAQQVSETNVGNGGSGSTSDGSPERFVSVENSVLLIQHPASWQAYGQADALTIAPRDGMVTDANGNRELAYGVIVNIFEPRQESYGRQLTGPSQGQGPAQDSASRLDQTTDQLVQEMRLSNRNMRVVRYREVISMDGDRALSTYLSNDSPLGGRETNWLVTVERPDGLLFIIFTAPEREFQGYEGAFHQMLRSVRLKR